MNSIALIGNPNSGKSSVFNQLTGLRQKVANFPGVTVEKKVGKLILDSGHEYQVIDFPGTYSLYPTSNDERVVLNVLLNKADSDHPDIIVYIADVTNLEKHLLLLTQIKDLGYPLVLALNMSDLADKEGLLINSKLLEESIGIPTVTISGREGSGVDTLKRKLSSIASRDNLNSEIEESFYKLTPEEQKVASAVKSILSLDNDYKALLMGHHYKNLPFLTNDQKESIAAVCESLGFKDIRNQISETMNRFDTFVPVAKKAVVRQFQRANRTDRLDALLTHKYLAPLIFFIIMFFIFQAIYAWAEHPMNWIESGFAYLGDVVRVLLPAGWFTDLLTDGILTGLAGILVFVPQIAILFFLITLLEEIGYMARAVFIFDKLLQQFGLNGRSIIALVSGGACAIPAVMSTRTIANWKERIITIMVTPLISCSARIPVYTVLIGFVIPEGQVFGLFNQQGLAFMGLYLLGIIAALSAAIVFRLILKSSEKSWLMMELPRYRLPDWKNVWFTIKEKVFSFIFEAGKVIMIVSIILWVLASYGPAGAMEKAENEALTVSKLQSLSETETADLIASRRIECSYAGYLGKFIEPAIEPLGFDWKIGIALITSFAAREVFVATMATIYSIGSSDDEASIKSRMSQAQHPTTGLKVYTPATSLSLLIFYVFAMQCMSTLAVVRKETNSWKWPIIQFLFMGILAYFGSFLSYQLMSVG
jgi:ferrous iron transport protein B